MPLDIVALDTTLSSLESVHNDLKIMTRNHEEKCPVVYLDRRWPMYMMDRQDMGEKRYSYRPVARFFKRGVQN